MPKRDIFYSFHFDNDVMRVQLVRNIGSLEENKPVTPNKWEEIKNAGTAAIEKWIADTLYGKSCLVVLIGSDTYSRKWVKYEIKKAWNDGKGVLGVFIHKLKCPRQGTCSQGANPFDHLMLSNGSKLSSMAKVYNPNSWDAYGDIVSHLEGWIEDAISLRKNASASIV
jgi:hypothetical protein